MNLNTDAYYQAVLTHDPRFDGVFFVGVKTTGIYCRTVCPAKTPNIRSCLFFENAALAERAGFRPCLRCRPELAPGNGIMDSVPRLAAVAANRIEDGALSEGTLEDLARDMGISSRHLRRVIEKEYGVTPVELAQTQRLLHSKRLLADSQLSITEIAFASGFTSVRRFNALFLERYGLNPGQIRKSKKQCSTGASNHLVCQISYRPPFDWISILEFLEKRCCPGVEAVIDGSYMRTASVGRHHGWLAVKQLPGNDSLLLEISESLAPVLPRIVARVKRLFDTYADPAIINDCLGELSIDSPGLRLIGAFDGFELATRAVLGQQVTVKAATLMAGRVASKFGTAIETPFPELNILTPEPSSMATLSVEDITTLGITRARAATLLALAEVVANGLSLKPGADVERTTNDLTAIKGIGQWTAQYIAMRALGWPDAFPHGDLGLQKALAVSSDREVLQAGEKWRPWRAYAVMHLWARLSREAAGK